MNFLIAPDSFKGSLSAVDVAGAVRKGLLKADHNNNCVLRPVGDGGEGTAASLVAGTGGSYSAIYQVKDPLGRKVSARYGITGDEKTAIIELAEASGLHLLKREELDPLNTNTYGTGELIRHSIEDGFRDFIICLGGSATNDGGTGLLSALGFEFLDAAGAALEPCGGVLGDIAEVTSDHCDPRLPDCTFTIASDVTNPLVGRNGAAYVFAPQKGADPSVVEQLDAGMHRFAYAIKAAAGRSLHDFPGAGAAGGTAAGLIAFLQAELESGIKTVMEAADFEGLVRGTKFDAIITGEGAIDEQTAGGKVIAGIAEFGRRHNIPVFALAGKVALDLAPLYEIGLTAALSITAGPVTLEESIENAEVLIEQQAHTLGRIFKSMKG